jgi:peptidyl-dipeptidase A
MKRLMLAIVLLLVAGCCHKKEQTNEALAKAEKCPDAPECPDCRDCPDCPAPAPAEEKVKEAKDAAEPEPTAVDAELFMEDVETELLKLWIAMERANWVKATYITHDTEILAAKADAAVMAFIAGKAAQSVKFAGMELEPALERKFNLLKIAMPLAAPNDDALRDELAQIAAWMDSQYGKGKYCPERLAGKCLELGEMYDIMASSRDYDELLDVWQGWRKVSVSMRPKFQRFVQLANQGAVELGFGDLGQLWRSGYDMTPEQFAAETDRLWLQVKPLYDDLHCYVRTKLGETYGEDKVPPAGPIPAHLLGNMWAQEWNNLFGMLAPQQESAFNLDEVLQQHKFDELKMTKTAENFFVSLGLDPLPESFWQRSMFSKPKDRDVVCHASAWDIDYKDDVRIKMCIRINSEDFTTIHHELGHNYYQRAYKEQPTLFMNSANDGFHEALGDLISLSVTPSYMVKIGLIDTLPPDNLNPLMKRALDKVAFLPFGLLVDRWRWEVFSGAIPADKYNAAWWNLRTRYQGIVPPLARSEADFDPGAKYHIPANVPYTRYFLATILQFQFHRALCKGAGHTGPLHTCSIYGNKEAGKRISAMMKMGLSKPWPEAMLALSGQQSMDATAILEYFAPLHQWLKVQNKGKTCGW